MIRIRVSFKLAVDCDSRWHARIGNLRFAIRLFVTEDCGEVLALSLEQLAIRHVQKSCMLFCLTIPRRIVSFHCIVARNIIRELLLTMSTKHVQEHVVLAKDAEDEVRSPVLALHDGVCSPLWKRFYLFLCNATCVTPVFLESSQLNDACIGSTLCHKGLGEVTRFILGSFVTVRLLGHVCVDIHSSVA